MKNQKFTKGPWKVLPVDKKSNGYITIESDFDDSFKRLTCTIYGEHSEILGQLPEKTKANALLISKAPEMLEMLVRIIDQIPTEFQSDYELLEEAKNLIKEATEL